MILRNQQSVILTVLVEPCNEMKWYAQCICTVVVVEQRNCLEALQPGIDPGPLTWKAAALTTAGTAPPTQLFSISNKSRNFNNHFDDVILS